MNTGTAIVVGVALVAAAALAYAVINHSGQAPHAATPAPPSGYSVQLAPQVQQAVGGAAQVVSGVRAVLNAAPGVVQQVGGFVKSLTSIFGR